MANDTHITKDGQRIFIIDMDTDHLLNTVRMQKRKAKEGLLIKWGGGYKDEPYNEAVVYGENALLHMNHKAYAEELEKRGVEL
jgi:hypothetical protein